MILSIFQYLVVLIDLSNSQDVLFYPANPNLHVYIILVNEKSLNIGDENEDRTQMNDHYHQQFMTLL